MFEDGMLPGSFANNHQPKHMTMNKFTKTLLASVLLAGTIIQSQAADKKLDPSGTYIWTQAGRNGGPDRTNTLVLKMEGDKLTGKVSAPGRGGGAAVDSAITDVKLTGADVTFNVVRDQGGMSVTNKYVGKLADGAIKGTIDTDRGGQVQSRPWEAKLQK
jgi:hypothetical protein